MVTRPGVAAARGAWAIGCCGTNTATATTAPASVRSGNLRADPRNLMRRIFVGVGADCKEDGMFPDGYPMRTAAVMLVCAILTLSSAGSAAQATTDPVWATPDHFWFRATVPGGHEWWHVDARHGIRERLFDHRRLASEINQNTDGEYTALTLPFADPAARFVVSYDGSNSFTQEGALAIAFTIGDKHWRCELQGEWDWGRTPPSDYYCDPQEDAPIPIAPPAAVRSPDGKWDALVQNGNVVVRAAGGGASKTLSNDGTAIFAYQPGSIQWSRDSRTLSAYRVHQDAWRTATPDAHLKPQIVRAQWAIN